MARIQDDKPGRGWFSRAEMAAILDVTVQQFDRGYRRYAAKSTTKEHGGKLHFHARSMLDEWALTQNKPVTAMDADPLLAGGGGSPALEEYRRHAARQKKVDADLAEKSVVPLTELEPALMHGCSVLRQAGDTLARQYGNDAAMILNEAVGQWEESLGNLLAVPEAAVTDDG